MTLNNFIVLWSDDDGPIGDLAADLIIQSDFPFKGPENEIMAFLETETERLGLSPVFKEFKKVFEESR